MNSQDEEATDEELNANLIIKATFWSSFIVVFIALTFYLSTFHGELSDTHTRWAEFGDYFGGVVGSFAAILGFYALLATILLQNKALNISRKELYLTRKELKKTAKASKQQAEHFDSQAVIQDCEATIDEISRELDKYKEQKIAVREPNGQGSIKVVQLLENTVPLKRLRTLEPQRDVSGHLVESNKPPLEKIIAQLLEILYDQILKLKNIEEAPERYKIYLAKYFWLFVVCYKLKIITWDWKEMLNESYKVQLDNIAETVAPW